MMHGQKIIKSDERNHISWRRHHCNSGEVWCGTSTKTSTVSFHIPNISFLTDHPLIRRCTVRVTDSVVKQKQNTPQLQTVPSRGFRVGHNGTYYTTPRNKGHICEAASSSASREIPRMSFSPNDHYQLRDNRTPIHIPSQMNPIHVCRNFVFNP